MARAYDDTNSLRFSRHESERVVVALLMSVLIHFTIWGGYQTGNKLGWWQKWHMPKWLHQEMVEHHMLAPALVRAAANQQEPTIYVDVSHADADAPQQTKYYSSRNSRAANPDVANANAPKINGRQTDAPKTEDVPKPVPRTTVNTPAETSRDKDKADASKLQPATPSPSTAPPTVAQTDAAEGPQTPGETARLQPKRNQATPTPDAKPSSDPQPERPRTLRQALAQRDQSPGVQMHQEGGVPQHAFTSSLDAKATPFGEYDAAIIDAVSTRWYELLESRRFAEDRTGKVTLRFKLKSDGSVIEMETVENTVGELLGYLCQESIEEAAPFAKWPPDMVRMIGSNFREVTFTFYYY